MYWASVPTYLAIGMTADEFWHGDPRLCASYREAERIKRDNRNTRHWQQGQYVFEAMLAASPAFRELSKGIEHPYPSKPFVISEAARQVDEEEKERLAMEKNMAFMSAFMSGNNRRFQGKEDA